MLPSGAPLSDWLARLETLSPNEIDLGLERVQFVLDRLRLKRPRHVFIVAGTNGKGSSVRILSALLSAAGMQVGAYTSPHVRQYNERIAIDNCPADDADIVAAFEAVEAVRDGEALTYFEYGTLAAATVFAARDLDVWVLEVGLGGRLDATNAIEPTASLITNIALDHCDWLGNDVESIAVEKAGVMRAGKTTVFGDPDRPQAIDQRAEAVGANIVHSGTDFEAVMTADGLWTWKGPARSLTALQKPGLLGRFQVTNAAAVLALLDSVGLLDAMDVDFINAVLPNLSISGRSERREISGHEWWIDVAHNPAAAGVLAATLSEYPPCGKTLAIIGMLDDKDVAGVIGPLSEHVETWIAMSANSPRAIPAGELAQHVANQSGRACLIAESVSDAVNFARQKALENDRILATGSFFTVGPVLDYLASDSPLK